VHGKRHKRVGTKPIRKFGDMFAACVVEVLAGGKYLDCLRTGPGSQLQQAWVQALFEKQVR
jgi:hypothetical protein